MRHIPLATIHISICSLDLSHDVALTEREGAPCKGVIAFGYALRNTEAARPAAMPPCTPLTCVGMHRSLPTTLPAVKKMCFNASEERYACQVPHAGR